MDSSIELVRMLLDGDGLVNLLRVDVPGQAGVRRRLHRGAPRGRGSRAASARVMVSTHGFAPRTFPHLIGCCADLVISMRMHMTIYSLLAGVPFVAIAYEQKSVELCRTLGIGQYCEEAVDFAADLLAPKAIELHARRADVAATLRHKRAELIPLSVRNAELLLEKCVRAAT